MSWTRRTVPARQVRPGDYLHDHAATVATVTIEPSRRTDKARFVLSDGTETWRYVFQTVELLRQRKPNPHVQAVLDTYREAREVWEQQREQWSAGYTTEMREYASIYPPPRFSEFLKDAGHGGAAWGWGT